MTSRLIRRTGAATLIAAAAATVLTGCGQGFGAKLTFNDTENVKVTDVVVTGNSGDVSITTAAVGQTQIKRVVHSDSDNPGKSYTISGTTLNLDTSCGRNCRVSYEITAPTGVKVRGELHSGSMALVDVATADVEVTSGDLRLERIAGDVTARASSGFIEAHALSGAAKLTTTSGNIDGADFTGGKPVTVEASSGNVKLHLVQQASVTAKVSSGNVELVVPQGAYRIRDNVHSGNFESILRNDDSAAHTITITATSGNAEVATL